MKEKKNQRQKEEDVGTNKGIQVKNIHVNVPVSLILEKQPKTIMI